MTVKINKDLCIGCGTCVNDCGDVFELDSEGKSKIKKNADLEKNSACIKESADLCPSQAIEVK